MRQKDVNTALSNTAAHSILFGKRSDQPLETPHGEPLDHYRARAASLRKCQPIQADTYNAYLQSDWRQDIRTLIDGQALFTVTQIERLAQDMGVKLDVGGWSVKPVQLGLNTTWNGILVSTYVDNNHVGVLFKSTGAGLYSVQSIVYDLPEISQKHYAGSIH